MYRSWSKSFSIVPYFNMGSATSYFRWR